MLHQRVQVQTTHLNDKYEAFTTEYKELCRLVMEMRSYMSGSCGPFNWSHGPDDEKPHPPLPPLLALLLF